MLIPERLSDVTCDQPAESARKPSVFLANRRCGLASPRSTQSK